MPVHSPAYPDDPAARAGGAFGRDLCALRAVASNAWSTHEVTISTSFTLLCASRAAWHRRVVRLRHGSDAGRLSHEAGRHRSNARQIVLTRRAGSDAGDSSPRIWRPRNSDVRLGTELFGIQNPACCQEAMVGFLDETIAERVRSPSQGSP